jgi:hypothetical protein
MIRAALRDIPDHLAGLLDRRELTFALPASGSIAWSRQLHPGSAGGHEPQLRHVVAGDLGPRDRELSGRDSWPRSSVALASFCLYRRWALDSGPPGDGILLERRVGGMDLRGVARARGSWPRLGGSKGATGTQPWRTL